MQRSQPARGPMSQAGGGPSSWCRLRGLPFNSSEHDVAQWFACAPGGPLNCMRVLFTYNNAGRKSGEAVRKARSTLSATPTASPDRRPPPNSRRATVRLSLWSCLS